MVQDFCERVRNIDQPADEPVVRMVEEVEEFSANLEPVLLRQMDTTLKSCIRFEVCGTDDRVAAQISECEGGGNRLRMVKRVPENHS